MLLSVLSLLLLLVLLFLLLLLLLFVLLLLFLLLVLLLYVDLARGGLCVCVCVGFLKLHERPQGPVDPE